MTKNDSTSMPSAEPRLPKLQFTMVHIDHIATSCGITSHKHIV
jgi:hypothetical protein